MVIVSTQSPLSLLARFYGVLYSVWPRYWGSSCAAFARVLKCLGNLSCCDDLEVVGYLGHYGRTATQDNNVLALATYFPLAALDIQRQHI